EGLLELVRAFCRATGSEGDEPELVARHLVEANLAGHDSHGIGMLPDYVRCIKGGMLVPNRHAEVLADFGAVLVLDGGRGYGRVIADEAMRLGIGRRGACRRTIGRGGESCGSRRRATPARTGRLSASNTARAARAGAGPRPPAAGPGGGRPRPAPHRPRRRGTASCVPVARAQAKHASPP
ncbi:MAG TPA: Ldh family oxidoreductase, partial [Geminicoccaceae bacterium]|nr:Ldh family oxidoreductase [Geminicoccaceae bacterium]